MEFITKDNKVYKIIKIEVAKDLRLRDIDEEIAKLEDEKSKLNAVSLK